jgi:hypothetical protein
MKTSIKTISLLIIFYSLHVGCLLGTINEKVVGNGDITTKKVSTADYEIINGVGIMDIHLEKGAEGNITITADDNLHEYLKIEVKGKELLLKTKSNINISTKKGIHITVPFEEIKNVTLTGSGDIDSKDVITANEFTASVMGSGDIVLDIEAQKVKADIMGSGDITLSGSTTDLELDISGSGNFKGYDLKTQSSNVSINGSGDAKVHATESLKARIFGSGDINYKGNPVSTDFKTSGSGDISSH